MKKATIFLLALALVFGFTGSASALLISGQDIIAAPGNVNDDAPGATNFHQQGFNEQQGVSLISNLMVDDGFIAAGTVVNSHMIFLNTPVGQGGASEPNRVWGFDGEILGVMSDRNGTLEVASSGLLGAIGTLYPGGAFAARGMEGRDAYTVSGSQITVSMFVSEPGDWIRVVTRANVPEPATLFLLGTGLLGLAGIHRRIRT